LSGGNKGGKVSVYYEALQKFFKTHTLCPKCKGEGYIVTKRAQYVKASEVSNIRYYGIKELETLSGTDGIIMSEVIREILEHQLWGRKSCDKCDGSRFIERAAKKTTKKVAKKKTKLRRVG